LRRATGLLVIGAADTPSLGSAGATHPNGGRVRAAALPSAGQRERKILCVGRILSAAGAGGGTPPQRGRGSGGGHSLPRVGGSSAPTAAGSGGATLLIVIG